MGSFDNVASEINAGTAPVNVANAAYINAQTQGQNLQNQGTQLGLDWRKQLLQQTAQQSGTGTDSGVGVPGSSDGDFALDEAHARNYLQQKYAPMPNVWSPQDLALRAQAAASGIPGAQEYVVAQHDARINNINGQRQQAARKEYSDLYGVANSDSDTPGSALEALRVSQPKVAEYFESQGWTDDDQIRAHAAALAGLTHSEAQLPVEFTKDGTAVDKVTQEPIPKYDSAVGLSAENRATLITELAKPTTIKNSDGSETTVPTWQATGRFSSLEDAVRKTTALANQHGVPGNAVAPIVRAAADGTPPPGYQQAPASAPPQSAPQPAPGAPAPAARAPAPAAPPSPLASVPPAERAAYSDPDFKLKTPPVVRGTSQSPAAAEQAKATVQARTELLKDSSDATQAAGQALMYTRAAQQIMQSKGAPTTGFFGPVANEISRVFGGVNATNYAEVAKYLGNAALQNARQNYGSRMTSSEVQLQLNELSPSVTKTPEAINDLLAGNAASLRYTLQSAQRTRPYLATGGDPQQFSQWQERHFPRENVIAGATQPQGAGTNTPASGAGAMPDPALNKGRSITNRATGQKMLSDGTKWTAVGGGR